MKNKLSYIDVVNETVEYYSKDTSRRSIDEETDICLYNGPDGKKCAFSRVSLEIPEKYEEESASTVLRQEGVEILKIEYRHLNNSLFWDSLQAFHDSSKNWDNDGLTEEGLDHLRILKEKVYRLENSESI